jgi:hypothetical protein
MAKDMQVIWVKREWKYFCEKDWTTQITLESSGTSSINPFEILSPTPCLRTRPAPLVQEMATRPRVAFILRDGRVAASSG